MNTLIPMIMPIVSFQMPAPHSTSAISSHPPPNGMGFWLRERDRELLLSTGQRQNRTLNRLPRLVWRPSLR